MKSPIPSYLLTYSKMNFISYYGKCICHCRSVLLVFRYFNLYLIDTKFKSFCQQADLTFDVVIGLLKGDWLTWSALTTDWLKGTCVKDAHACEYIL